MKDFHQLGVHSFGKTSVVVVKRVLNQIRKCIFILNISRSNFYFCNMASYQITCHMGLVTVKSAITTFVAVTNLQVHFRDDAVLTVLMPSFIDCLPFHRNRCLEPRWHCKSWDSLWVSQAHSQSTCLCGPAGGQIRHRCSWRQLLNRQNLDKKVQVSSIWSQIQCHKVQLRSCEFRTWSLRVLKSSWIERTTLWNRGLVTFDKRQYASKDPLRTRGVE